MNASLVRKTLSNNNNLIVVLVNLILFIIVITEFFRYIGSETIKIQLTKDINSLSKSAKNQMPEFSKFIEDIKESAMSDDDKIKEIENERNRLNKNLVMNKVYLPIVLPLVILTLYVVNKNYNKMGKIELITIGVIILLFLTEVFQYFLVVSKYEHYNPFGIIKLLI